MKWGRALLGELLLQVLRVLPADSNIREAQRRAGQTREVPSEPLGFPCSCASPKAAQQSLPSLTILQSFTQTPFDIKANAWTRETYKGDIRGQGRLHHGVRFRLIFVFSDHTNVGPPWQTHAVVHIVSRAMVERAFWVATCLLCVATSAER